MFGFREIVLLFDKLLLCKPGGEVAFFGPFNHVVPYLQEHHLVQRDSKNHSRNVADIAIEAMSLVQSNGQHDLRGNKIDLSATFKQSEYARGVLEKISQPAET